MINLLSSQTNVFVLYILNCFINFYAKIIVTFLNLQNIGADGVATGTISGISKKADCTYSVKVFAWDDQKLKGYSYTVEQ